MAKVCVTANLDLSLEIPGLGLGAEVGSWATNSGSLLLLNSAVGENGEDFGITPTL